MSMQTLVREDYAGIQAEVMKRQADGIDALLPKTQDKYRKGDWHQGVQELRSDLADNVTADTVKYFGALARSEGVYPDRDEEDYWQRYWLSAMNVGKRWPEPRREQKVREFSNDWWALMKVFEHEGSPAWPNAANATVQKAFTTTTLQSVFPLFFDTNIQAGILANPVLDRLVMRSVPVDSHSVTHVKMTEVDADQTMSEGGEGTTFVQLIVNQAERAIQLRKFGGEILWTYEVMRLQRLDVLGLSIQRIGTRYQQLKTDFALATLIDGDGGGDGAATTSATATSGSPIYTDLITAEFAFPNGYMADTIIAPKQVLIKMLGMSQYQDPLAGVLHQTTGNVPTPLGMDLVRWDATGKVSTYTSTTAVMLDQDLALIEYTEGGIITESERIIRSQWERSVTTQWVGYGVWDRNAAVLLTGW